MAECHPVAFRWVMQGQARTGAKLIHVDPRFTRTSAMADIHAADPRRLRHRVPGRADQLRHQQRALEHGPVLPRVRRQLHQRRDDHRTTSSRTPRTWTASSRAARGRRRRQGVAVQRRSSAATTTRRWQYAPATRSRRPARPAGGPGAAAAAARPPPSRRPLGRRPPRGAPPPRHLPARRSSTTLVRSLLKPPPPRDATLQDPRCVFQILKRHFARYTPEMVERVCGCPQGRLPQGRRDAPRQLRPRAHHLVRLRRGLDPAHQRRPDDRHLRACCSSCSATSAGRARGILALRGHATIQGSTDMPTLYHSIPGYMPHPSALRTHDTLEDWLRPRRCRAATGPTRRSSWSSYLKSLYGERPPRRTTSATTGTRKISATTRTCRCSRPWPTAR